MTTPVPTTTPRCDHAVRAVEENLWSLWSGFGQAPGSVLHRDHGVTWFQTPIHAMPYQTLLRFVAEGPDDDVERRVDTVMDHFRSRPLIWMVHPSSRPADLPHLLEQRGLAEIEVLPAMIRSTGEPVPAATSRHADTTISPVGPDDRDAWIDLVAWRYSLEPADRDRLVPFYEHLRLGHPDSTSIGWVARIDGVPVAKTLLHRSGDVAGIYGVVTRPEARGCGLARALTTTAMRAARDLGCRDVVLHSTPMAESLYLRLGFRHVAPFRLYAAPDTEPF